MTWSPPPILRQFFTLSVLFLLLGAAFSFGEKVFVEPLLSRSMEIADLSERLTEVNANQKNERFLAQRQLAAEQELRSLDIFWSGPNRPQVAASIQDVLRTAAQQSDGQMLSTSVLEEASKDKMIAVRARIDGTLMTLQTVLSAIDHSRPRLFVNSFVVTTASAANTLARPQLLSFEVSVAGYVAANDHAAP